MKSPHSEHGMALLGLIIILALAGVGVLINSMDPVSLRNDKDKKTHEALAEAKTALLGFATARSFTNPLCGTNCPRPGDLPCPDTNNDGLAESSCGSAAGTLQASRLGRLPWRTLGLDDLRDGDGERLWYAVSNRYKNNTRFRPLNSDTKATITLRDSSGNIINDAAINNGLAALIISPGASLVRQDNISQVRNGVNQLNAANYLDVALGEDNQNFVDSGSNGFIAGKVLDADDRILVNDTMLKITSAEMSQVMEARVIAEVKNALSNFYTINKFFPSPANFNNISCLGSSDINAPNCAEGLSTHGRIPANPLTSWNSTSILRGVRSSNWFQLNGWREVIHYAVAPACITGNFMCNGIGFLTLTNAQISPENNKQIVIIGSGPAASSQLRATNADKLLELNYLEGENLLPLDDVYTRIIPLTIAHNDRVNSLP